MTAYLHKKPFNQLNEQNRFMTAHVDYGTVVWAGNIDSHPKRSMTDLSLKVDIPLHSPPSTPITPEFQQE